MSSIRVLLVDDDPLVRSGLTYMMASATDIEVVGEVGDGDEVAKAVREMRPHVVLMDLRMPRMSGIEATRLVRSMPDAPHVIALTTWEVGQAVVESLEAGAAGFLLKSGSHEEILGAIRAVVAGDAVLSPRSTRQLLDQWRQDSDPAGRRLAAKAVGRLTQREREVAIGVAEGLTNAEIGQRLFLSEATVKTHLSAAQTKLDARSRVNVAVLIERAGLLTG